MRKLNTGKRFSSILFEAWPIHFFANWLNKNSAIKLFWLFFFFSSLVPCFFFLPTILLGYEMDDQSLDERFGCPNCRRSYKHKKHLYRHLRQGCDEMTSEAAAGQRDGQSSHIPIFRCSLCSYTTYLRASLFQHTQIEHEQTVVPSHLPASSIHFLLNSSATQNGPVVDKNTFRL